MKNRDRSPKRNSPLDELEKQLDVVFREQRDYFMTAQKHQHQLLSIPVTQQNNKQFIRLCQKLTWLMVFPRNYNDGLWETF